MSNPDWSPMDPPLKKSPIPLDECGMALAAAVIGDRWTLLILRAALYGVRRFDDLRADLKISSATLATRLTRLADAGLLKAQPYRDGNARTRKEYILTEHGAALQPVLFAMMQWADARLADRPSALIAVSARTGEPLDLAYVDRRGRAVAEADVRMEIRS
ncbi:MAG: helix-turn-helix domain-containing protein [Pseudomonadota bacterium]